MEKVAGAAEKKSTGACKGEVAGASEKNGNGAGGRLLDYDADSDAASVVMVDGDSDATSNVMVDGDSDAETVGDAVRVTAHVTVDAGTSLCQATLPRDARCSTVFGQT